ncbi:hypothetical protein [Streptomyces clavifer]|uniref:hypothetical protein n=1 Tax=Streptomyces clavifer TaxID=68188 RepID=UPI0033BDBEBD
MEAALSVVLGVLVGAGVNILTGQWSWTVAAGVFAVVVAWAALEWRRSLSGSANNRTGPPVPPVPPSGAVRPGRVDVDLDVRELRGEATGARRSAASAATGETSVRGSFDTVDENGKFIGYDEK